MIAALLPVIGSVLDKIFPDKTEAEKAKIKLIEMAQAGEFKAIDADLEMARNQTEINKTESAHHSVFVSGWRPFVGWVCGAAMVYQYIARPFLIGVGGYADMPGLDNTLWEILAGMLGIAGLRTWEKVKGVARS